MYINQLKIKDKILEKVEEEILNQKNSNEKLFVKDIINNVLKTFSVEKIIEFLDNEEETFENLSKSLKERIAEKIYNIEFEYIKEEIYLILNTK